MKRHLLLLPLLLLTTAATAESVPADGLYTWTVPTARDVRVGCWVGDRDGFNISTDEPGSGELVIIAQMRKDQIIRLKAHDRACAPSTNAQRIDLDVNTSIDFLARHLEDPADEDRVLAVIAMHESPRVEPMLEKFASKSSRYNRREKAVFWLGQRGGEAGFRFLRDLIHSDDDLELRKKAIFSISQSRVDAATGELINIARNDKSSSLRRDALFWLGQKASSKAAGELRRAVDEDPDDDVREHAVFAISQLPHDRSVPILIDLVRHHKSAKVREKALFWLGQTNDPRALDLIEEILTK